MTAPVLEHYPRYGTFVWMDERLVRVDTTVLDVRETMRDMNFGEGPTKVTLEPQYPGSAVFVDKSPVRTFQIP